MRKKTSIIWRVRQELAVFCVVVGSVRMSLAATN